MMKNITQFGIVFVISLIIVSLLFPQSDSDKREMKYSEVKIHIENREKLWQLYQSGIEVRRSRMEKDYLYTVMTNQQIENLKKSGISFETTIEDLNQYYDKNVSMTREELNNLDKKMKSQYNIEGFELGSMGGYYTLSEIEAELDSMRILYSNLVTVKQSIGKSIEGRDIWMLKISDNPDSDEDEPEVLFDALHHPDEPESMAVVMYFMYYLLENYGTDPFVTFLVDNRELYFVPALNPDGHVYNEETHPNGGGMWRKNKRDNNENNIFEADSDGVDLNKNYGYQWGYDDVGSNPIPSNRRYRGTGPFSEPETQAMRDLCLNRNFKLDFSYHAGLWVLFQPWGYINELTPDSSVFIDLLLDMSQYNHIDLDAGDSEYGPTNGMCIDWMYGEQVTKEKIYAITPEVFEGNIWASPSEIYDVAEEFVFPNLVLALGQGVINTDLYIQNTKINSRFIAPDSDSLLLTSEIVNSNSHPISVTATLENFDYTLGNTIPMFDDGIHFDSLASDGIYGGLWPAEDEDKYYVHVNVESDIHGYTFGRITDIFTTIGPIEVDHYDIVSSDTIPNHGDRIGYKLTLRNGGKTAAASDVKANLICLDSCATIPIPEREFGDIAPGSTAEHSGGISIIFGDTLEGCLNPMTIKILVEISSDGYVFWYDTLEIEVIVDDIEENDIEIPRIYALFQNYPNPFNPVTMINYQLPITSDVVINAYNLLGQKVATLVNERKQAGYHQVEWDASGFASGIYYYRIEAGEFHDVKKMILIK